MQKNSTAKGVTAASAFIIVMSIALAAVAAGSYPLSAITKPVDGSAIPAALGSYSIAGTATDRANSGINRVEISLDGGGSWLPARDTSGNGSFTKWDYVWSPLPLGNYSITSRATDNLQNVEVPAAGTHIIVDGTPPSSSITAPLTGDVMPAALSTYSIKGNASDGTGSGVTKVEVSTDNGVTWAPASGTVSWSYIWTLPGEGQYKIKSRATDLAGNVETPGTSVTVEVDRTPPVGSVTINNGVAYTKSTSVALTLSATDTSPYRICPEVIPVICGVSQMQFSSDGTDWIAWETAATAKTWALSPGDGPKTVYVRFKDAAGNVSASFHGNVTLDGALPASSITDPSAGIMPPSPLGTYSIKGNASDGSGSGVSKVEVSTDGGNTWAAAAGTSSWSYTWTLPADGNYTIKSRATDNAANMEAPGPGVTVTLDRTPPASIITGPAAGATVKGTNVPVTGTASDGGGTGIAGAEVSTDGGATWNAASGTTAWSYTWAHPADGSYTIKSRAVDLANNNEAPGPGVGVVVDNTPPASTITSPAAGAMVTGATCAVSGTASDGAGSGVAQVEVSTDGGATWTVAAGTASWSYAWTLPADGSYTIRSRAADLAANIETPGPGVSIVVDKTPPTASITNPVSGSFINGASYAITGSADDGSGSGVTKVEISTDGGASWTDAAGTTTWTYAWSTPPEGPHTIKARATDAATNVETAGPGVDVTVDRTPPTSVITSPAAGALVGGATVYTITGTAGDAGGSGVSYVEISTDGGSTWAQASGTATWSFDWALPPDGSYTIKTRAYDQAANAEAPGAGVTVSVDTTPPTGSIAPRNGKYSKSRKVWLTLSARDAGSNCPEPDPIMCNVPYMQFSSDSATWLDWETASTQKQWDFGSVSDGVRTVYARYKDPAGNVSNIYSAAVTFDSTAPISSIASPINGSYVGGGSACVITGAASDAVSGVKLVEVSTDGGQTWFSATDTADGLWTSWSYTWPLPADAGYSLKTRATDNADNVETPSAGITVTVDKTPPAGCSVTINSAAVYTNSTGIFLTLFASDAGSGVAMMQISNDGVFDIEPWEAYSASKTWTLLSGDGTKAVYARSKDGAGNISPSASDEITLDSVAPAGSITINGGSALTGSVSVSLTLSASDAGSGIAMMQISNDGVFDTEPWEAYAGEKPWTLTSTEGQKTVYARFKDAAGNVSETSSDDIVLSYDTAAPVVSITTPADGLTLAVSSYTITGTADDGTGSGVNKVEVSTDGGVTWDLVSGTAESWSYAWNIPAAGTYTVLCRATDNIGNSDATAPRTVTAHSTLTANRASVTLNYDLARPPAMTKIKVTGSPLNMAGAATSTKSWLTVSTSAASTPSSIIITVNPAGLAARNYTGTVVYTSAYAANGQVSIPVSLTTASGGAPSPELPHFNWSPVLSGGSCNFCHIASGKFIPASSDIRQSPSFCRSCHNLSSAAHERGDGGSAHTIFTCASSGGGKWPTYGSITSAQDNNRMFSKLKDNRLVICVTCHNTMGKKEDYGRKWELAATSDRYAYYLSYGGWANYGYMEPIVYRTTNIMGEPAYSKTKKSYLVSPSEYTYDEEAGSITFASQQAATSYIYATLDYPYLRASSEANRICLDCHREATHKGANCLTCHQAHNTGNLKGIREKVRASNFTTMTVKFLGYTGPGSFAGGGAAHDGVCEVCHTKTKYYRQDGSGFGNHSGGANYDRKDCTACHSHYSGFGR